MSFTGQTVFRLLTWRPAGAEGEHVITQALSDKQLVRKCVLVFYLLNHLISFIPDRYSMFLIFCMMTFPCCRQDSISQKSLDIQSRSDDQHSISSADRFTTDNHRQSKYSSASGISEDGSRSRTAMRKSVTSTCVFHRGPGASPVLSVADQMCGAAGADPDHRQHCVFSCHQ